jgi:hypothetical protein
MEGKSHDRLEHVAAESALKGLYLNQLRALWAFLQFALFDRALLDNLPFRRQHEQKNENQKRRQNQRKQAVAAAASSFAACVHTRKDGQNNPGDHDFHGRSPLLFAPSVALRRWHYFAAGLMFGLILVVEKLPI